MPFAWRSFWYFQVNKIGLKMLKATFFVIFKSILRAYVGAFNLAVP